MRDEDLEAELRAHLEIETDEQVEGGLSRPDAEAAARRAFGSVAFIKEATRDTWRWRSLERLAQDARYALRLLRRNPAFALAVITSIALGVGAETAVFSVVNGVLLRPLAFAYADRLVTVAEHPAGSPQDDGTVSGPDFDDFREQNTSFERLAAFLTFSFPLTDTDDPILVRCTGVSPELFDVLGMKPVLGRVYEPESYHVDGQEIILSYGFWQRRFGGDPGVLGHVIYLNHEPSQIIGVMPPTVDLLAETDLWAKYIPDFEWARQRDNHFLSLVGLLRPGVSVAQARQELQAIYRRVPGVAPNATIQLATLKDRVVGGVRDALVVLLGAVGLVLLIACANVANLLLARGAARQREIATRFALGASRGRLVRQFLTESLLLAALGGAAGVGLAFALVRMLLALNPGYLPRTGGVRVDGAVLAFAVAISVAAGLMFGVAPVVAASRDALHDAIKSRGAGNTKERWTRGALVAVELAVAVVLLTGAGLLARSFWRVLNVAPGFRPDHVLTLRLRVPDSRIEDAFYPQLLDRVAARPGVVAAAVSDGMPTGFLATADLVVPGRPADPTHLPTADACFVSAGYFRALGIPLRAGRWFSAADGARTPPVVVVSESVARALWPRENAVGRLLAINYRSLGRPLDDAPVTRTVVGVVADVRQRGLEAPSRMGVYLPFEQDTTRRALRAMVLLVRTAAEPQAMAQTIQADVRSLAPDVPVQGVATLDAALRQTLAPRTFSLALLAAFAGFALLLAAGGLYGVISYAVARRAREIAIRMALGAQRIEVLRSVLTQELRWLAIGLAVGLGGAWGLGQALRNMLFGIGASDVATFAAVIVLLGAVSVAACWNPASRAVRVDPLTVLREE